MMGGAGINSVSSAQSRRAGIGVEHRGVGLGSGRTGGGGREAMAVGGSDTSAAVKDGEDSKTARLWGVLGEQGRRSRSGGCSDRLGGVSHCPGAAACDSEWGRAGDTAVDDENVVDDMAFRIQVPSNWRPPILL